MPPSSYFRSIHPLIRRLKDPNSRFGFRFLHSITDRPVTTPQPLFNKFNAPLAFEFIRKPIPNDPSNGGSEINHDSVSWVRELVGDCHKVSKAGGGGLEGIGNWEFSLESGEVVCECFRGSGGVGERSGGVVVVGGGDGGESVCFRTRGIRLSYFVGTGSGCAVRDVSSLEGGLENEQLNASSSSSDQKKLGDRSLKLHSGSCYIPHPDKEETGGEDAHFICDELAIGVADGVGGWAAHGVDAGKYARELMSYSVKAIQEEPKGSINPVRVLEKAYTSTKALGSSTACIIALTDQGLRAVNLGDSGFIVVRDGCTVFRSPVQQHDFNFTYQLESGNASDLPSAAQVFTVAVESGDAIVAGTDGLFDNLYNNEITAVVVHAIRAGLGPQVTAQKIAALARQRAVDKNRQTPFSTAAQDAGYRYYGGKLDDITVVVSYVTAFGS